MLDFLSLFIKVNFEKLLYQNKCCVIFWKLTGPKLNVMSRGEINEKTAGDQRIKIHSTTTVRGESTHKLQR